MTRTLVRHFLYVSVGVALMGLLLFLGNRFLPEVVGSFETFGQWLSFVLVTSALLTFWGETLGRVAVNIGFWGVLANYAIFFALSWFPPFPISFADPWEEVLCFILASISFLPAVAHRWEESAEDEEAQLQESRERQRYIQAAEEAVRGFCARYSITDYEGLNALVVSIQRMIPTSEHVGAWLEDLFLFGWIAFDPEAPAAPFVVGSVDNPDVPDVSYTRQLNELFQALLSELSQ